MPLTAYPTRCGLLSIRFLELSYLTVGEVILEV